MLGRHAVDREDRFPFAGKGVQKGAYRRGTRAGRFRVVAVNERYLSRAERGDRLLIALAAAQARHNEPVALGKIGDAGIAKVEQLLNTFPCGLFVGGDDRVDLRLAGERAVGQHDGHTARLDIEQIAVVAAGGIDDQPVDLVFKKALDGRALTAGLLAAVGKQHLIARLLEHLRQAFQEQRGKGVRHVAERAADQLRVPGLEALGRAVGAKIELADHALDALDRLRRDIVILVVEAARNRRLRDAAAPGHIVYRNLFFHTITTDTLRHTASLVYHSLPHIARESALAFFTKIRVPFWLFCSDTP